MALKSVHFITPIKLVLPGIIVSLVGASTALYMEECAYLKNRDTITINKILNDLSKTYSIKFEEDNFLPDITGLRNKLIGEWSIALYKVRFGLKPDGTGYWSALEKNMPCTWQLDSTTFSVKYTDGSGGFKFSILRATNDILNITQHGAEFKNNSYIACRIN